MSKAGGTTRATMDLWRRWVTIFGAVLQVVTGALVSDSINVSRESLVLPAGWTFGIWSLIFLLSAVFAVYQALPSMRYDPLLRRVGWPLGLAFVGNGLWTLLQVIDQPVLPAILIVAILALALTAFVRFVRFSADASGVKRWIAGLPTGLLAGWLTVANVASANDLLAREGVIGSGLAAAFIGAALIAVGAIVAFVMLRIGAAGPLSSSVAYTFAVVWGLFGIVANQYDTSLLTTLASVVCLVALIALMVQVASRSVRGRIPARKVS